MAPKSTTSHVTRSAITGKFTTKRNVKRNPKPTETETVKKAKPRKR